MQLRKKQSVVLACLILVACTVPHVVDPNAAPAVGEAILPNLLVLSQGRVEIRRLDSAEFVPVTLGAELSPGDLLVLHEGDAAIFCGNEAEWERAPLPLEPGKTAGVPCGVGRPPGTSRITARMRGASATSGPQQVLYPRTGRVLSERPTLGWRRVDGATAYTVTLRSDDGLLRTPLSTTQTEMTFPDEWEPLEGEGANYSLYIEASNGITSSTTSEISFYLLEPDEKSALENRAGRLRRRPLDETSMAVLLAHLYLSYNLRSETVAMLSALPLATQTVAVQQLLGDTYLEMGLLPEAQTAYTHALELAQADGFSEAEAAVHAGLGKIACVQQAPEAAAAAWQHALDLYTRLSLAQKRAEMETLLQARDTQCQ